MPLTPGTRLGPYEVTAQIGAGGMGEVYRATDTNLGRQVAIKVLPDAVAQDAERLARFDREARTLAALNHPNIAALYGLEKSNSTTALVMELVEGQTLADRITQGAIPFDEALPIAKQIAEALEAAHEQGIIHRDLKPANIKVRSDGTVKVLDFGLAKAMEPAGAGASVSASMSPTITTPAMTQAGMILGTAAYMSPEQAKGQPADTRSDVWALGCVLFEMLTGRRAFEGEAVNETIATVLRGEPHWDSLPALPPMVRSFLRRCLKKDPRQRLRAVGDMRLALEGTFDDEPGLVSTRRRAPSKYVIGATAAVFALVALVATTVVNRGATASAPAVSRVELNIPVGVELSTQYHSSIALSPDATTVAFIGTLGGTRRVYIRPLQQYEATVLPGTEQTQDCFFSPDGRSLGLVTPDGIISIASLTDGLVAPAVRQATVGFGGAWTSDGRIVFVRDRALWQVSVPNGTPAPLTTLDQAAGESLHAWPAATDGAGAVLFTVIPASGVPRIDAVLPTGERRTLIEAASFSLYVETGHVLFFRDGALFAVPFDPDRVDISGSPVRVLERMGLSAVTGMPMVAVSRSGTLLYPPNDVGTSRLAWAGRDGSEQVLANTVRLYRNPRLLPNQRSLVVEADGEIWLHDVQRDALSRLTSEAVGGSSYPTLTPDGTRLVFRTLRGMLVMPTDGGGPGVPIAGSSTLIDVPGTITPDGRTLAFLRQSEGGGDIYVVPLDGSAQPQPLVATAAYEGGAQFSPDGRWLVYASDESGRMEVYVRPYPGPERRQLVSTSGGTHPLWNANGRELFYRAGNQMMSVAVSAGASGLILSSPRVLFEQRYSFASSQTIASYAVSADGQRFVMVKDVSDSARLNLVLNWSEELRRLVGTN